MFEGNGYELLAKSHPHETSTLGLQCVQLEMVRKRKGGREGGRDERREVSSMCVCVCVCVCVCLLT